MNLEQTFSPKWINLLRRLHMVAKTKHVSHSKLIRLSVVVDSAGTPLFWGDPECIPISPSGDEIKNWVNEL